MLVASFHRNATLYSNGVDLGAWDPAKIIISNAQIFSEKLHRNLVLDAYGCDSVRAICIMKNYCCIFMIFMLYM